MEPVFFPKILNLCMWVLCLYGMSVIFLLAWYLQRPETELDPPKLELQTG